MTVSELLTPAEVARLFRVDPKTVSRWAKLGRLDYQMTLGGHRRFDAAYIYSMVAATVGTADLDAPVSVVHSPLRARIDALTRLMTEEGHMTPYARTKVLAAIDEANA